MVRRTSEIGLFDAHDYECLFAKYGINGFWNEEHFKQHEQVREILKALDIPIPEWFDKLGERHYFEGSHEPHNPGRTEIGHRRMSNNSIVFTQKPVRSFLNLIFQLIKLDAEPGFLNFEEASRRRENMAGVNP